MSASKRKKISKDNSKTITEYFSSKIDKQPTNQTVNLIAQSSSKNASKQELLQKSNERKFESYEKQPAYRQKIMNSIAQRAEQSNLVEETSRREPDKSVTKQTIESYEKKITDLQSKVEKLQKENEDHKAFIQHQDLLSESLYSDYNIEDHKVTLISVDRDPKYDRKYIKCSLDALYARKKSNAKSN